MNEKTKSRIDELLEALRAIVQEDNLDKSTRAHFEDARRSIETAQKRLVNGAATYDARQPSTGIYYYLWLDPEWKLETYRSDEFGQGVDHMGVWNKYVVPLLGAHYALDALRVSRLKDLMGSMPRGRVDEISAEIYKPGERPGDWVFYHGDDAPSGLVVEAERRKLTYAFGLSRLAVHDKVKLELAGHEKMIPEQKQQLQQILGKTIPY